MAESILVAGLIFMAQKIVTADVHRQAAALLSVPPVWRGKEPARETAVASERTERNKALLLAAFAGDAEEIRRLVKLGVDIDVKEAVHERTPLMVAFLMNQVEAARALLENGADVRARDRYGKCVLDNLWMSTISPEMKKLAQSYDVH